MRGGMVMLAGKVNPTYNTAFTRQIKSVKDYKISGTEHPVCASL